MTQEEKQLLLVDLCARLPYGVKVKETWWEMGAGTSMDSTLDINVLEQFINNEGMDVFPYLRPMSSMTEEEKQVLELCNAFVEPRSIELKVDFYNLRHLDYRGLIQKGLAISTEVFNPYKTNHDKRRNH